MARRAPYKIRPSVSTAALTVLYRLAVPVQLRALGLWHVLLGMIPAPLLSRPAFAMFCIPFPLILLGILFPARRAEAQGNISLRAIFVDNLDALTAGLVLQGIYNVYYSLH